jgi:lipopolysaccharide biosynthesis glycosyltransferase
MTAVIVTDDNYAQHLGVMLTSLFENKRSNQPLRTYLISNGLHSDNQAKLNRIFERYQSECIFLDINPQKFAHLSVKNHMSHAAYYKISIPELIPEDKVIFLDCDLVIKEDISCFWNLNITEYHLAAVENPDFDRYDQLGIPLGSRTFNSGVMLLNLNAWRKDSISEKVMEFLIGNSHKTALHDQDGFNSVLYDKWLAVAPKWNQQTKFFSMKLDMSSFSQEEWMDALKKPAIIHYTTSSKPWQYTNIHPFKAEYYKYLKLTEWSDFTPHGKNLKNQLKKWIIMTLPSPLLVRIRKNLQIKKNKVIYEDVAK